MRDGMPDMQQARGTGGGLPMICPNCGSDRRASKQSDVSGIRAFSKMKGHTKNGRYICLKCGVTYSTRGNGETYLVGGL